MQAMKKIFTVAALCALLAPIGMTAQEWPRHREEIPKWAKAVKDSGAKAD